MGGVSRVVLVLAISFLAATLAQKYDRSREFNRSVRESLNEDEDFRNILKVLTQNNDEKSERDVDKLCAIVDSYEPTVREICLSHLLES